MQTRSPAMSYRVASLPWLAPAIFSASWTDSDRRMVVLSGKGGREFTLLTGISHGWDRGFDSRGQLRIGIDKDTEKLCGPIRKGPDMKGHLSVTTGHRRPAGLSAGLS
jgi:hypothetical protein